MEVLSQDVDCSDDKTSCGMDKSDHEKNTKTNPERVPTRSLRLRIRYWSSWEELTIVELWRKYRDQMTTFVKSDPAYRLISNAMREKGFLVTPQECRRKINSIHTQYKTEHQQVEKGIGSEWRLYPLVHCMLTEKTDEIDRDHEKHLVESRVMKSNSAISLQSSNTSHDPFLPHNPASCKNIFAQKLSKKHINLCRAYPKERLAQLVKDNEMLAIKLENDMEKLKYEKQQLSLLKNVLTVFLQQNEIFLKVIEESRQSVGNLTTNES